MPRNVTEQCTPTLTIYVISPTHISEGKPIAHKSHFQISCYYGVIFESPAIHRPTRESNLRLLDRQSHLQSLGQ
ncbi:hypothetical protein SFRURICE_007867 [Spodoptera frugiperda]|nr:hypothetical protein SFRURICE_007867 [Spodoptera frugiperda]